MDLRLSSLEIYTWISSEKSTFIKNFEVKVALSTCHSVELEKKKESSCPGYLSSFCMRNKCKVERRTNFLNSINISLAYPVSHTCLPAYQSTHMYDP